MKEIFGKVYTDDLTGKKLRAYVIDDEIMLMAVDIAVLCGYTNSTSLRYVVTDEVIKRIDKLPFAQSNGSEFLLLDKDGFKIWFQYVGSKKKTLAAYLFDWIKDVTSDLLSAYNDYQRAQSTSKVQELESIEQEQTQFDRIEQKLDLIITELGIKGKEDL